MAKFYLKFFQDIVNVSYVDPVGRNVAMMD